MNDSQIRPNCGRPPRKSRLLEGHWRVVSGGNGAGPLSSGERATPVVVAVRSEEGVGKELLEAFCLTPLARARHLAVAASALPSSGREPVREEGEGLVAALQREGLRHVHLVAAGSVVPAVLSLVVSHRKLPRTLLLVDPVLHPASTLWQRSVDVLERWLPFGLPLRSPERMVDVRYLLHRVRVPTYLLTTHNARYHEKMAANGAASRMPFARLISHGDINQLSNYLTQLHGEPLKCPQRSC